MGRRIGLLRNLGPVMERDLARIGIDDEAGLREAGAVAAYVRLCFVAARRPSLNALHAMEAALRGIDWRDLGAEDKDRLNAEAAAILGRSRGQPPA